MKKGAYIAAVVFVMLIVTRAAVRIIDATVGIDDGVWLLILFLVVLDAGIALLGRLLYRKTARKRQEMPGAGQEDGPSCLK